MRMVLLLLRSDQLDGNLLHLIEESGNVFAGSFSWHPCLLVSSGSSGQDIFLVEKYQTSTEQYHLVTGDSRVLGVSLPSSFGEQEKEGRSAVCLKSTDDSKLLCWLDTAFPRQRCVPRAPRLKLYSLLGTFSLQIEAASVFSPPPAPLPGVFLFQKVLLHTSVWVWARKCPVWCRCHHKEGPRSRPFRRC